MNVNAYRRCGALLSIALLTGGFHVESKAEDTQAVGAKEPSIEAIVEECVRCHRNDQSLDEVPDTELIDMVIAMVAGEMDHPTEIPELSEEQVKALVHALKPE